VLAWFESGRPFLVADDSDGRVVGWARVSAYSDRQAYAGVGEHGVYVAPDARGQGIGRRLLEQLASAAEDAGYYKLTSRVSRRPSCRRLLRGGRAAAPRPTGRRVEGLRPGRAPARPGPHVIVTNHKEPA
jgi:GNAT superfamily N-acetyltransferase